MSHEAQRKWCEHVKMLFPAHFTGARVLDVGSLDVNGNNRYLFTDCDYVGIDLAEGPNVDVVSMCHQHDAPDEFYDTIISTEVFEHDLWWSESIRNICRMLRPGGLFVFTCGGDGRGVHGTADTTPGQAPFLVGDWAKYYRNLQPVDIEFVPPIRRMNPRVYSVAGEDLQFYGFKT